MNRGINRERQVRRVLEGQGWWVGRCAGSLGDADLVALRADRTPILIEVKSSPYAYAHFGPEDRIQLLAAAEFAGAEAVLAHWPPRGKLVFLSPDEWPDTAEREMAA